LPLEGHGARTSHRDSVLAEDLEGRPITDSYRDLRQWLGSAMPKRDLAMNNLCRSENRFQSWAASFISKPNYFTVDQTDFRCVCKMILDSGRTLQRDRYKLFMRVESVRHNFTRLCTTDSRPNTLRGIIALRIMNISEKENGLGEPENIQRVDVEILDPIPASILDITLSSNQVDVIEQILPHISDARTRELYGGIRIKACAFCRKPKFHILDNDVYPLLRNLTEFPQDTPGGNCAYHKEVCSSCRFKWLIRDIAQEWWHDLTYYTWLKPRCSRNCYMNESLTRIDDVDAYILKFNGVDPEDQLGCMNMYDSLSPSYGCQAYFPKVSAST